MHYLRGLSQGRRETEMKPDDLIMILTAIFMAPMSPSIKWEDRYSQSRENVSKLMRKEFNPAFHE